MDSSRDFKINNNNNIGNKNGENGFIELDLEETSKNIIMNNNNNINNNEDEKRTRKLVELMNKISSPESMDSSKNAAVVPTVTFSDETMSVTNPAPQTVNFKINENSIESLNASSNDLNNIGNELVFIKNGAVINGIDVGSVNLCFGSGTSSLKDESSTANLLSLNTSDEKSISTNKEPDNKKSLHNFILNKNLKPLNKSDINNASQSSMDTRIKFGEEPDLIPLITLNSNGHPVNCHVQNSKNEYSAERWYIIFIQVLLPFLIAGFGMVAAGVVLDKVQHWELYKNIQAIYTLVPALLGLKGNLEMTLASRLSTQVNLGTIHNRASIFHAVLGNFALTQGQAIIVGFLASVGALTLKLITEREFDFKNAFVLISGSMSTASFASLLLAGLMMFVIIVSKKLRINPDNIATPIAASLGDLVTLTILSFLCTFLYQIKSLIWIHILITVFFLILVPVFIYYSYKNEFVRDALYNGWTPIIMAMIISSAGGSIMGLAVNVYADIAVFQPVVNGVGGNLVAIFASRMSTALHRTSTQGTKPSWAPKKWYHFPAHTFFAKSNPESKTALVLILLALPGHLLFFFTISKIKMTNHENSYNAATTTLSFTLFYLFVSSLQVVLLLLICYWLVHFAWRLNKNPDNICIPYLTAIGDLLGTAFLAICFHILYLAGATGLRRPV